MSSVRLDTVYLALVVIESALYGESQSQEVTIRDH